MASVPGGGTPDPNWSNDRARLILHDAPDPRTHPSVSKRTWIILGVVLTAVIALMIYLLCTETFYPVN